MVIIFMPQAIYQQQTHNVGKQWLTDILRQWVQLYWCQVLLLQNIKHLDDIKESASLNTSRNFYDQHCLSETVSCCYVWLLQDCVSLHVQTNPDTSRGMKHCSIRLLHSDRHACWETTVASALYYYRLSFRLSWIMFYLIHLMANWLLTLQVL